MARWLTGARRHFENASITLTLFASAPTGGAYIVEIIIINRIHDEAIQCLSHWFILKPRHSSEREDRIATHFGNIRTSRFLCVHFLHLHNEMYAGHTSRTGGATRSSFSCVKVERSEPEGLGLYTCKRGRTMKKLREEISIIFN